MIENERKYVLLPSITEELKKLSSYQKITQGYIQNSADGLQIRFRKTKFYEDNKKTETKRIFTLKSKNSDFTSTEIEIEISKPDFDSIWPKVNQTLEKIRYKVPEQDLYWEIDVFYDKEKEYFWMAEIELPDKQEWPTFIPDYIKNHLLYKVPLTDVRFSSKKLCDVTYANNVFKHLIKEKK